jgi:hypothetical protein
LPRSSIRRLATAGEWVSRMMILATITPGAVGAEKPTDPVISRCAYPSLFAWL